MLTVLTTVLVVLLAIPLLGLIALRVAPGPLLSAAQNKAIKALDVEAHNRQSPYAGAGFQPVHRELADAAIRVEGEIPADLEGVYLRNGTNTAFDETSSRLHMFNGAGMLHQIQIRNGEASYSNSYVRTPRFAIEAQRGAEVYPSFGDLAGGGKAALARILVDRAMQRRGISPALDNRENSSATTAVQYHHGKLYCLQETGFPFALNTRLEDGRLVIDGSGEWETFDGGLDAPFTAHPKIDPDSGDWYTFSTDLMTNKLHYAVIRQGKLAHFSELLEQKPIMAFLHDYYLTEHYAVFPDLSMRFDSKQLMDERKSPFYFDPEHKMRFGVIKRDHGSGDTIQWFDTELPGHIWHTINAWEETRADGGTDIVLYAPVYRDYPPNVPIHTPLEPHAHLTVYRLNLDTGEVTDQRQLLDHFYERPSFNTAYLGRKSRYAYLLDEERSGGIMGKGVLKYDLQEERELGYFDYGDSLGGEALFVPRANASAEDDGYLVDLLMTDDKACLVIIDATTMEQVAKLHLPQRVPYGVHSCWLDSAKLAQLGNHNV